MNPTGRLASDTAIQVRFIERSLRGFGLQAARDSPRLRRRLSMCHHAALYVTSVKGMLAVR
jgi:hypothetical protein